jgi:NOL1/NOP2/fmu family ribosome biogenesis protein
MSTTARMWPHKLRGEFEPNHALALALPADGFSVTYELLHAGDRAVDAYLRGETLPSDGDRGWLALTYDGFPIGWGKEAKGTIKNFYPKGLRRVGV